MEIKVFDREFVERTISIIEHPSSIESEYDITLLTNCMLALVVLPIESTSNSSISKKFRSEIVNELARMNVIKTNLDNGKLFRAIKNAISHMHIEFQNKDGNIDSIVFWDKIPGEKEYHTVLQFSAQQLKDFALFVANKHLNRLSNKKL